MLAYITGPVRSGKSTRAEQVAVELGGALTYVATARLDPDDREMADRVERHRADRGPGARVCELWTADTPDLPALVAAAPAGTTLLVDSLGTWIAGHLLDLEALAERDAPAALGALEERTAALVPQLAAARAHVVIVGDEAGWGVVPPSPLGRVFRDHAGRMGQALARAAQRAELVVAGYAIDLKATGVAVQP